jgi:hypothetical protein
MVITRRRGVVSRRWETSILRGEVSINRATFFGSVSYLPHMTRERVFAIHGDVANYIDELGGQGATLYQAFDTVTLHLVIQRFIERKIAIYEDCPDNR